MRVLITNNRLDRRGGAESFVRDLGRALQTLGHTVIAYSAGSEGDARLLQQDGIPVATDLEGLQFRPDIIHGQHHLDTMVAVASLRGVPAIFHCHGAGWLESLPFHPRIRHYAAMSRTLSERLRIEFSLPDDRIDVVFNGVDLEVFRTVRTPPPHPRRALLFNSFHAPGGAVARALEQACGLSGLQFEAAGTRFGRRFLHPENELPEFDLVFASGRSAIEAMACGCAVVVIGRSSVGELVAPDNFDRLREVNFSVAANRPPPADEEIAKQLECYDPASAAAVTGRIRAEADSIKVAERLLGVYGKAMERQAAAPEDLAAEAVAMARYLRKIVPVIKATDAVQRHGGLGIPKLAAMLALEEKAEMFLREIRPPA